MCKRTFYLFIAGNTPHLCSSGHVPAILVLAPSLINIIYCTSWEMQQTPQVIMRLEWKWKILSKLEIFFKIYMLPFSLFPMPIGVVVVVVVQPCGSEETTHSPADSNAHLHWAPLGFPTFVKLMCTTAKEQYPVLTELERKIVFFYTYTFF